jgi:integrase-like protein
LPIGSRACAAAPACGIFRIRPYTPRTNGKAEHFIQTLLREWAYRRAYASSRHRTEALPARLYYFSWERGHGALHGRPPIRFLAASNNLMAVHHPGLTHARGRGRPRRRILLGYSRRVL